MSYDDNLRNARSLDDLGDALEYRLRDLGFAGFAYWTHLRRPVPELTRAQTFTLFRGPVFLKAFEAMYFHKALWKEDPAILVAPDMTAPYSSREAYERFEMNRTRRWLYRLNKRFGFFQDINIPAHTPLRVQVLNAFTLGNDPGGDARIRELVPVLSRDFLGFCSAISDFIVLSDEEDMPGLMFSRREQECLAWMAKGRSNAEIAGILGISERTVKFHVAGILKKLGAANRTEAIAIAARSGWIVN